MNEPGPAVKGRSASLPSSSMNTFGRERPRTLARIAPARCRIARTSRSARSLHPRFVRSEGCSGTHHPTFAARGSGPRSLPLKRQQRLSAALGRKDQVRTQLDDLLKARD